MYFYYKLQSSILILIGRKKNYPKCAESTKRFRTTGLLDWHSFTRKLVGLIRHGTIGVTLSIL
jgi:hypothetical protein